MRKIILLITIQMIWGLLIPGYSQEKTTDAGTMPITISNCTYTWGLLKIKGCYGAAEKGEVVCIGQYEFFQTIDDNNMVTTSQIFIETNGQLSPKACGPKIVREDW